MIEELLEPIALQRIRKARASEQLLDVFGVLIIFHAHPHTPTA